MIPERCDGTRRHEYALAFQTKRGLRKANVLETLIERYRTCKQDYRIQAFLEFTFRELLPTPQI